MNYTAFSSKLASWQAKGQMSEIILTSSEDRAASSTGMLSGHKSLILPKKAIILKLFDFYTWNTKHFQWVVEAGSLDKCPTIVLLTFLVLSEKTVTHSTKFQQNH